MFKYRQVSVFTLNVLRNYILICVNLFVYPLALIALKIDVRSK